MEQRSYYVNLMSRRSDHILRLQPFYFLLRQVLGVMLRRLLMAAFGRRSPAIHAAKERASKVSASVRQVKATGDSG